MPHCLQVRVVQQMRHHELADSLTTMGFIDEDIAEVCEGGAIRNHSGDTNLLAMMVQRAGHQGIAEGTFNHIAADAGGPV